MAFTRTISLAMCFVAISTGSALAQAPFTIRQPADGSTTREKVKVEIPRASIRPGGFVSIYIDGKFRVALNPNDDTTKPFTYYWDTKSEDVPDGEHTIRAILAEPASQGNDAVNEIASSEVKINLANKIKGVTSLLLRYKFHEGDNLEYLRTSRAYVVGLESALGKGTGDIDIISSKSKLVLGVDDVRPDDDTALVRNKLTYLSVLAAQQDIEVPREQLSGSLFEELDKRGIVKYGTGNLATFAQFASLGLPVENSLTLPVLPLTPITIGGSWSTPGQSLELPGLPSFVQKGVKMENKFEGVEWEGNYQTAKIRQSYKGNDLKRVVFGSILITQPTITIDKVLYFAYKSGRLIRTVRTLTLQGRTSSPLPTGTQPIPGADSSGSGYGPGAGGPPPGLPGRGGPGGPLGGRGGYGGPGGPPGRGGYGGPPTGSNGGYGDTTGTPDRPITIKTVTETVYLEDVKA